MMKKRPPSFRRFLLIMVFLLEGLSLAVVIGFLFAMLDQSMKKEQVSHINVNQAELRLHLSDRLNYVRSRVEDIQSNNNIKIALLLDMHGKIAEKMETLYPRSMGSTFYVSSTKGDYFPPPADHHVFLNDINLHSLQKDDAIQRTPSPYTFVYTTAIKQQNRIKGYVVGIYDLTADPYFSNQMGVYKGLPLVYKLNSSLADLNSHRPLGVSSHRIIEELTQKQYGRLSEKDLTLLTTLKDFPSLFLIIDNKEYRQERWSMVVKLVLLCLPLLLLTFSVSFLILKRITSELDSLAKNALYIAQTDGHSNLDTANVRHTEFLYFIQAFNRIMAKVRRRTNDLENANKKLQTQYEERRQMAAALLESESQLRSLQNNIPIGLFRRSFNGSMVFANPKLVSIFGYDSENELVQIPVRDLYHDPMQYDFIMDQFKSNEVQNLELRFKRKDGRPIWGAVHLKRTSDPKSGDVFINGAILDITDQKKIEEEKNKLEAQLRQARKMEAIGTLAGGIAHDFNNILFAIIGYCELALDESDTSPLLQDNIQQAMAGARRASKLVNQILTFARQTEIEKRPLNLTAIIRESLKLMRATLPTSIEFRTNLHNDLKILADPTQIHQVVVNLFTNAGHAMLNDGGVLTIALTKTDIDGADPLLEIGLKPGPHVLLQVKDTGHGMSTETMERIFDPYYTTKSQGEGSGMGLSVVQGIVRGLKGTITVKSGIGKGSTFNVYIPALDSQDSVFHQEEPPVVGGRERILVVDDELPLTRLMTKMLSNMGYLVTTHNNPVEALAQFRHAPEKFDMVISDVTMPQMAGPEMAREMLKIRPGLPLLLCTGYSESISEKVAANIGVRALVHKPLVRHELCSAIRSVLDKKSAA